MNILYIPSFRVNKVFFFIIFLLSKGVFENISAQSVGIFGSSNLGINNTGAKGNASSVFDISSTTGGLLIPRVTQAQRTNPSTGLLNGAGNLPAAAQGLLVYQTDGTEGFYYNTSTTTTPAWVLITSGNGPWSKSAGNIFLTTASDFVGIGTNTPPSLLSVGTSSQFQVNSSGAISAATGISSSGTIAFSGLSTNGIVRTTGGTGTLSTSGGAINLTSEVTNVLPIANGGTNISTIGSAGSIIYSNALQHASTAAGNSGQVLQSAGAGTPVWTTSTFPSTTTINQLLYSSAANTVSGLTTANTSALVTSSGGVPSFTSGTTANRLLRTNGTTISFAQADLSTDVSNILPVSNGGTNISSYTVGDLLYASGATTLSKLADVGIGSVLTSGGVGVAPSWSSASGLVRWDQIAAPTSNLTLAHASNITAFSFDGLTGANTNAFSLSSSSTSGNASSSSRLLNLTRTGANTNISHTAYGIYSTVANTNATSGTNVAGYFSASGATTANYSAIFDQGNVGVGTTAPPSLFSVGSSSQFQINSTGAIATSTGISSSGTIAFSGLSTNGIVRTTGGTGTLSTSGGAINLTSEVTNILPIANGGTNISTIGGAGSVIFSNGTQHASTVPGNSGQIFQSAGAGTPVWTTATFPSTTTINQLLYSSAANTVSGLTTANTSVLVTSSGGVPSFTSGTTANRLLRTNGTTISFAQADLSTDVSGTLPVGNGGTSNGSLGVNNGGIIYADGTKLMNSGAGLSGQVLTSNGSGAPSWTSPGLLGIRWDLIAAPTANLTLAHGSNTTTFSFDALSGANTNAFSLSSSSTAGNASSSSRILNISRTGANTNTSHTAYGIYATVANTNATSGTNVAGYFSATGATTANYAAIFDQGNVGVGNTAPPSLFSVGSSSQFQINSTGAIATSTGISSSGTIAFSGLSTNGIVRTTGGTGTLSTSGGAINLTSEVTNILPIANGGTNISTIGGAGSMIFSNGTQHASTVPGNSGQILQSAGAGTPVWTTATFPSTTTINQILYSSASNTVSGLAAGNTSALVTSSGGVPSFTSGATANRLLRTNGTIVSFAQADLSTDVVNTLPVGNGGTGITSYTIGDLVFASATSTLSKLADVSVGSYLRSGGAGVAPLWSTLTLPNTATTGDLLFANANNSIANLADVATGSVLTSGGVGTAPSWSSLSGLVRWDQIANPTSSLTLTHGTNTTTMNSSVTTGTFLTTTGSAITTGQLEKISTSGNTWTGNGTTSGLVNISSTSTGGSGNSSSILLDLTRSGANASTAHTAYGVYSTVTNTNATSGTNVAGYFSASGATTGNYAAIFDQGNVGIGTSAPLAKLNIMGSNQYTASALIQNFAADNTEPRIMLTKSRNATIGSNTLVLDDDITGNVGGWGNDGSTYWPTGLIKFEVDGVPGANDMPGRITLSTTADGALAVTERMRITSAGNVGIGTTIPIGKLDIRAANVVTANATVGNIHIMATDAQAIDVGGSISLGGFNNDVASALRVFGSVEGRKINGTTGSSSGYLSFKTNNGGVLGERLRIDNSGNVGIGTTSPTELLYLRSSDADVDAESNDAAQSSSLHLLRSRGTPGSPAIISNGDYFGQVEFKGFDGSAYQMGAMVEGIVDGTPGLNDMPGKLSLFTTPDGSITALERMTIKNSGNVGIGTVTPLSLLHVEGDVTIPALNDYSYSTSKTNYYSVSAASFTSDGSATYNTGKTGSTSNFCYINNGTLGSLGYSSVNINLPNGAIVKDITAHIYDNDATYDSRIRLYRLDPGSALAAASTAYTTGSSASIQPVSTGAISVAIDNQNYYYQLTWETRQGLGNVMRLYGIYITYSVDKTD